MLLPPSRLFLFLCCAWWLLGNVAFAASPSPDEISISEDYVLRTWETDDGLPQNTISGITQTPDGYLWLATWGGLTRFDGVRFTSFFGGSTPNLESSYVRTVATDRAGDLWIGLERGGVARMREGRFEILAPVAPATSLTSWVGSFAEDTVGSMWAGLAPDVMARRWSGGQWTSLGADEGVGPGADTFVHADVEGRIWFASKMSCGVFNGERFQPIDPQGGERVRLTPARRGGMWAARAQRLLRYNVDGTVEEVADLAWLGGTVEVNVIYEDRAGDLWIGTRGAGLFRFREGEFVQVRTSHQAVLAVTEDRDGNLWVGTLGGGLNRLRPRRVFLRNAQHGLAKEGVLSLSEDTAGRLWLAVRDSAPVRAEDTSNRSFSAPPGWPGAVVTCLSANPQGGVLVGHDGGGLQRWQEGVYQRISDQRVGALLPDREGNVWIATMRGGLVRFRDGVEYPVPMEGGLIIPRALAEDEAGRIWAGTDDGFVFRQENGRFIAIPLPGARRGDSIRFFVPDGPETMWIGAREGGLLRWKNGRIDRLPVDAGLQITDLRSLIIEPDGSFWLSSGSGLYRTTRQEVDEVLAGRQRQLRGVIYGRDDGLPPNVGFAFGRRNATARTRDGHLWFATDRGALEIAPEPVMATYPLSPVQIETVALDGRPLRLASSKSLVFPPSPGSVEIRYTVPQLSSPERLRFRYRLAGLDREWTVASNQRTATFARLPPGDYTFEVTAREADRPDRAEVRTLLPFTVQAAWWETLAFRGALILLGALGVAALVWAMVLRRVRARMRLLEQQHALEKERSRIARDMHDEVGASLTRLALMSELAADEPEMAGSSVRQFGEIAQAARAVSGTLDQIVWTVNPRNDTLERLIGYLGEFAAEYLAPTGLDLRLELPGEVPAQIVPAETRHEVLLATKEALNNAVKHAGAKMVALRIGLEDRTLRIAIADDGQGFDPQDVAPFSNGLLNLRQRLASVGGSARIESQPGTGSTVILTLRLETM